LLEYSVKTQQIYSDNSLPFKLQLSTAYLDRIPSGCAKLCLPTLRKWQRRCHKAQDMLITLTKLTILNKKAALLSYPVFHKTKLEKQVRQIYKLWGRTSCEVPSVNLISNVKLCQLCH